MPIIGNPKHEAFAQALAKGQSAIDAYVTAGYKPNRSAASRLSTNVNVEARVTELVNKGAEKAEWTVADRLQMLREIAMSSKDEDPRVSIAAIAETNKMHGDYAPTKSELTGKDGGPIATESRLVLDPSKLSSSTMEEILNATSDKG